MVDDRKVSEEAISANFLIPSEENLCEGKTLAELCSDSLKEFNPMVHVSAKEGTDSISSKNELVNNGHINLKGRRSHRWLLWS